MSSIETTRTEHELPSEVYVPHTMPRVLSTWGMTATFVLVIMFLTNVPNLIASGAATFSFWILGIVGFFIPSLVLTEQQARLYPYEGSLYNWVHRIFPPASNRGSFFSFFASFCDWFPAIPLVLSTPVLLVPYLQGLNSNWFVAPWQQGLLIIICVAFSGLLALQQLTTIQRVLIIGMLLTLLAVVLLTLSGVVWLLQGHSSATTFTHISDFNVTWDNRAVFGVIGLAMLGANIPLRMAGEITARNTKEQRRVVWRHLFLGGGIVICGYLLTSWALLVVQGSKAFYTQFALISTVDQVLGKVPGNVTAICLMAFLLLATVAYQITYARLLLVAGIDRRLPIRLGRLNAVRAPNQAVLLQTGAAIAITALIYFVLPYVIPLGLKPTDQAVVYQNVMLAALSLVWAFSKGFLLLGGAYLCHKSRVQRFIVSQQLLPQWVLWLLAICGSIFCLLIIVDTVFNPWISQIDSNAWFWAVSGITIICLIIAAMASLYGTGQAQWEKFDIPQDEQAQ